jgi:phosphatidylserine/phosphatidylglycerophosphate/cardiolipin synthase-like enzyme
VTKVKEFLGSQFDKQGAPIGSSFENPIPFTPEVVKPSDTLFLTGPQIRATFVEDFTNMSVGIDSCQYQIDDAQLTGVFLVKLADGIPHRFILDQKNFWFSSCVNQAQVVTSLWNAGAKLRIFKPNKPGWSSMHSKTNIVDGTILLTGSCNLTHNGLENNSEHVVRTLDKKCVEDAQKDFASLWEESREVTASMIDVMNKKRQEAVTEKIEKSRLKAEEKPPTRSLARSMSAPSGEVPG